MDVCKLYIREGLWDAPCVHCTSLHATVACQLLVATECRTSGVSVTGLVTEGSVEGEHQRLLKILVFLSRLQAW